MRQRLGRGRLERRGLLSLEINITKMNARGQDAEELVLLLCESVKHLKRQYLLGKANNRQCLQQLLEHGGIVVPELAAKNAGR